MFKKIFSEKADILNLIVTALSLLTLIVYLISYAGGAELSSYSKPSAFAVTLLAAAILLGAAQAFFGRKVRLLKLILPYALFVLLLVGLMAYAYSVYYYVSVVIVGIDLDKLDVGFIMCVVLFVLAVACSVVNLFIPKGKNDKAVDERESVVTEGAKNESR